VLIVYKVKIQPSAFTWRSALVMASSRFAETRFAEIRGRGWCLPDSPKPDSPKPVSPKL